MTTIAVKLFDQASGRIGPVLELIIDPQKRIFESFDRTDTLFVSVGAKDEVSVEAQSLLVMPTHGHHQSPPGYRVIGRRFAHDGFTPEMNHATLTANVSSGSPTQRHNSARVR